jgi:uncharacterized protein YuzE
VLVFYDPNIGGAYGELSACPVKTTISLSDLELVDVNEHGEPVGVEFAVSPGAVTNTMIDSVVERFPDLEALGGRADWLPAPAYRSPTMARVRRPTPLRGRRVPSSSPNRRVTRPARRSSLGGAPRRAQSVIGRRARAGVATEPRSPVSKQRTIRGGR